MNLEDEIEQAGAQLAAIDLGPYRAQLEEIERERAELEKNERAARAEHAEVSATLKNLVDTPGSAKDAARAYLKGDDIGEALDPRPGLERKKAELRKAADGLSSLQKVTTGRKLQAKTALLADMAAAVKPVLDAQEEVIRGAVRTLRQARVDAAAIERATDSPEARSQMRRLANVLDVVPGGWAEGSIAVSPEIENMLDGAAEPLSFIGRSVRKTVPNPGAEAPRSSFAERRQRILAARELARRAG